MDSSEEEELSYFTITKARKENIAFGSKTYLSNKINLLKKQHLFSLENLVV